MATSGATLDSIYNRLSSAPEYHPFSADTFSDWSMEAGDIIRVSRDGKHYDSPVHTSQMTWRGQSQISISSDGNEKRESIAKATKRKYGRGGSGYRNDNHLWQELLDDYNGLYSFFEVTSSRMFVTFSGMYDGLSSDFEVTRSRMYVDFQGMYDGLSSEFEVTRSRMRVEFRGMYDGLSSDFEVTRSRMAADFQGKYDGLSSEFEVTRSRFHVEMVDSYNQLSSGIEAAANYSMMYAQNRTTRAYIMTRINADDEGEALIEADKIKITGRTTINDILGINDNVIVMKKPLRVEDGEITAKTLTLRHAGSSDSIGQEDLAGMIKSASVSGNVLTLIPVHGDPITFSKATSLSGSWSGRNYTVTAKQNNVSVGTKTGIVYDGLVPTGSVMRSGKTVYRDFIVYSDDGEGEADQIIMQKNIGIDATSVYNYGKSGVTLSEPTWNSISGAIPSSRIVTVSTSGRVNSSGTTDNLSKSVYLFLVKSGLTVYMRTVSTSGVTYAQTTCSDSNLVAGNIKNGVTIFGVTGSFQGSKTIKRIDLDSGMNHVGNWWNSVVTYTDGTTQTIITDQSTTGLYLKIPNIEFTSNGVYNARDAGNAGYQIVTVNVPGGGSSYTNLGQWYYTKYQLPSGLWHHQLVLEQSGNSIGGMSSNTSYRIYK